MLYSRITSINGLELIPLCMKQLVNKRHSNLFARLVSFFLSLISQLQLEEVRFFSGMSIDIQSGIVFIVILQSLLS